MSSRTKNTKLTITTGAGTTPIIEVPSLHQKDPLETPDLCFLCPLHGHLVVLSRSSSLTKAPRPCLQWFVLTLLTFIFSIPSFLCLAGMSIPGIFHGDKMWSVVVKASGGIIQGCEETEIHGPLPSDIKVLLTYNYFEIFFSRKLRQFHAINYEH